MVWGVAFDNVRHVYFNRSLKQKKHTFLLFFRRLIINMGKYSPSLFHTAWLKLMLMQGCTARVHPGALPSHCLWISIFRSILGLRNFLWCPNKFLLVWHIGDSSNKTGRRMEIDIGNHSRKLTLHQIYSYSYLRSFYRFMSFCCPFFLYCL